MKPAEKVAGIIADFRRESERYRTRPGENGIVSRDMEYVLEYLYGRLADALEALTEARRLR